jgi:BolA protein
MTDITRVARMEGLLRGVFAPTSMTIVDDSARHAGHAGAAPGGETHFRIRIVAERFAGQSRVARSRAVHDALAGEFAGGLHALSLELRSPAEEGSKNPQGV